MGAPRPGLSSGDRDTCLVLFFRLRWVWGMVDTVDRMRGNGACIPGRRFFILPWSNRANRRNNLAPCIIPPSRCAQNGNSALS